MRTCAKCKTPCVFPSGRTRDPKTREPIWWFAPSSIHYCTPQIVWYCEHAPMIREGRWPRDPHGVIAYVIRGGHVPIPKHTAENIAAEMDIRLICGWTVRNEDGTVKKRVHGPKMAGKLCEVQIRMGTLIYELDTEARQALEYADTAIRRLQTFAQFKRNTGPRKNRPLGTKKGIF